MHIRADFHTSASRQVLTGTYSNVDASVCVRAACTLFHTFFKHETLHLEMNVHADIYTLTLETRVLADLLSAMHA